MTRTATGRKFRGLPGTYSELVRLYPPRPLHDEADYENAGDMVDRLAGHALNRDQEDYLEAVSVFVEAYERQRWPFHRSAMTPLEALQFLLREHGLSASDLGRLLGSRPLGSAILRGRRGLSKTHIRKLADHFKVAPRLFL